MLKKLHLTESFRRLGGVREFDGQILPHAPLSSDAGILDYETGGT